MNILTKNKFLALALMLLATGSAEAATRIGRGAQKRPVSASQAARRSAGLPANAPAPSWASYFINQWAASAQARALTSPGRRLSPPAQPEAPQVQPQAGALIIAPQPTFTGAPSPTQIFAVEAGNGFAQNFQGGQPVDTGRSGIFEGPRDTPPPCSSLLGLCGPNGGGASGGNSITPR